jgi:hypothetical protein
VMDVDTSASKQLLRKEGIQGKETGERSDISAGETSGWKGGSAISTCVNFAQCLASLIICFGGQ